MILLVRHSLTLQNVSGKEWFFRELTLVVEFIQLCGRNIRLSLAFIVNKAICATAAIESHVLLSSAILLHMFSIHWRTFKRRKTTHGVARRRALSYVALRRQIRCKRGFAFSTVMEDGAGQQGTYNCPGRSSLYQT